MTVTVDRSSKLWQEIYARNTDIPNAEKMADAVYRYKVLSDKMTKERRGIKRCEAKKNIKY